MRRREFLGIFGGAAAAWPFAAQAQQPAPPPVIGFLSQSTPEAGAAFVAAVRKGLGEAGMVEGKDFTSEVRWANRDADRLPGLANDLVRRRVAVIVALNTALTVRAAKTTTTEIPIVFMTKAGLVTSLNRPGGNVTGISAMNLEIASKWVALLHELLPAIKRIAVLVNFTSGESARQLITGTQAAALTIGLQTEFVFADNESEIDAAFAGLGARAQALIIHPDALFGQYRVKLAALAIREKLPALSIVPDFAKAGGLMSYGSNFIDALRQGGIYVARILKGAKPGELPVQQATKFNFVINLKTAKAIGVDIPATLLARADEVIE
jgi:putative ABC transport system substrate-binding protein